MSYVRYLLAVLGVVAMFSLGHYRYIIERTIATRLGSTWSKKNSSDTQRYPTSIYAMYTSLSSNYKWVSGSFFYLGYVVCSLVIIYGIFGNIRALRLAGVYYGLLSLVLILLMLLSILSGIYSIGYGLAQPIKQFVESPLALGLFLIAFGSLHRSATPQE